MAEWWDWSEDTAARERELWRLKAQRDYERAAAHYDAAVAAYNGAGGDLPPGVAPVGAGRWAPSPLPFFRSLHPQEKMEILGEAGQEYLRPAPRNAGADRFAGEVLRYPFEIGTRPRDTGIRALQELSAGNYGNAVGYAASVIPSVAIPAFAAGREGDEDDWREGAVARGVSPGSVLFLDLATDPLMYVGPRAAARGMAAPLKKMGRIPQHLDQLRFGRGVRTELVDPSGDVIRRLLNSPRMSGLPLPQ